jgi:hypothetical protein
MLAQAGLLDATAGAPEPAARSDTEAAILGDPELTPEDREALLRVYRSLRRRQGDA